jgi:hypothetical protein
MGVVAKVVAVVVVVVEEAWVSGMEDEEGEGRWKLVAGATPSALESANRTRIGEVLGHDAFVVARLGPLLTKAHGNGASSRLRC